MRDDVLGCQDLHDIDVEVYHISYQQLCDILQKYGQVNTFGQSFAIVQLDTLPHYDFALPRQEKKTGVKHQDFEIDGKSKLKCQCEIPTKSSRKRICKNILKRVI